jgi:hypothetical protein
MRSKIGVEKNRRKRPRFVERHQPLRFDPDAAAFEKSANLSCL